MPLEVKYYWSTYDVNRGPLSDTILFDMSDQLKSCSSAEITFLAVVLLINSTSGHFVLLSIITNMY